MDYPIDPTVKRLIQAFKQLGRLEWHHRAVAGCKPSEVWLLLSLKGGTEAGAHDMKVSEISKSMRVTSPTVTQLIKSLEANGLVERHIDPTDRRAVGVKLTEKGEAVAQKAIEAFVSSFQGLIDYLGEEESNQLAELLFKMFHYFEEREARKSSLQWNGAK